MYDIPKYCPYCRKDIKEWGHDSFCGRPANASIVIHAPGLVMMVDLDQK